MKNLVQISISPNAGMPYDLDQGINSRPHLGWTSTLFQGRYDYNDGRRFGGGLRIEEDNALMTESLEAADTVIVHGNGPGGPPDIHEKVRYIPEGKRVLWFQHSPYWWWSPWSWGWLDEFTLVTWPGLHSLMWKQAIPAPIEVIPQFVGWDKFPGIDEAHKKWEGVEKPLVSFSPSNRGFQDNLHTKGFHHVNSVCEKLQKEGLIDYDLIMGVPYRTCLARKARAHIGIDDIVTGDYHRSALEYAAYKSMVLSGVWDDAWYDVGEIPCSDRPFYYVTARSLEDEIRKLAVRVNSVKNYSDGCWQMMANYWSPDGLLVSKYIPLLEGDSEPDRTTSTEDLQERVSGHS
jgi:hypothetical protein